MGLVSDPTRPAPRGRLARSAAALAALLGLASYVAFHQVTGSKGTPRCTVGSGDNRYTFTPEQASNAAMIAAVGTGRGLPERAVTIALATALQESALRNIEHGDRDSLGLFQQRPSQGWGTPEQILDPVYASGKFYEGLEKVPGYSRLPLTVAAQKVQRSGFPQAYAKHEPDAALLSAALTGRSPAALSCTTGDPDGVPGDPGLVRAELVRAFGEGAAPETVTGGPSAGRSAGGPPVLLVPVRAARDADAGPGAGDRERHGWELAQWAVARAETLRITEVTFGTRSWRAGEARGGWSKVSGALATNGETVRVRLAP
ncbi:MULTISPECIES: hypothetical protein [unclassified Streptomyces]|uniref:hypothetical protein n=1 Tax=unclassified Streptomyces TaxID=2593676 RepID=UPI0016607B44|nr:MULTISPECIES: hypothetical protein [unclassified Streptomyces]MBD0711011.1 hypothetical protein [Streptomyces sp. CBMA291]MBD0717719.1 hypothetical protein [Streptomyces sp. CBMA370]